MPRLLNEQVVALTGASSGIGRETAITFGQRGASVVLAARNEVALSEAAEEVEQAGGRALAVPTDVTAWTQVERLAAAAADRFGRVDTWINNAALYFVGPVEAMEIDEIERIVHVNLLGQIYGTKAALPYLTAHGEGAIINVASTVGARAVPLLALYGATKFAIRGFSEALRQEMQRDHPGITVTTILPASINTPFFAHGRTRLGGVKSRPVPPVYDPEEVAKAIVFAAEHPRRDIYVGPGRGLAAVEGIAPGLVDWLMRRSDLAARVQRTDEPDDNQDNFFAPMPAETYKTRGEWGSETIPISPITSQLELHPGRRRALLGAAALGSLALLRRIDR